MALWSWLPPIVPGKMRAESGRKRFLIGVYVRIWAKARAGHVTVWRRMEPSITLAPGGPWAVLPDSLIGN